jgi:hypothetical protein
MSTVGGSGMVMFGAQFAGALLQDIARWNTGDVQRSLVEREELQRIRNELLASLGVVRTFTAGAALVPGVDGRPTPRPTLAVVTADELVLLDADPVLSPDGIVDRVPLRDIVGVRLVDEFGDPVAAFDVDPVIELDAPLRRFVVWLDRRSSDGTSGANAFVFLAGSVAREAHDHFARLIAPAAG